MALLGVGEFRQVGDVSAAGALGPVAIQMLLDGAVPAVGQVAQQVVCIRCRSSSDTSGSRFEDALPVDDGKTSR